MYISELYFKTTDEIEKYRETHPDRINILKKANTWNKDTYGETDPDIDELLTYLDALRSQ